MTPATAAVIRNRMASGSRADGATLAVVLEGGGMRGVVSAAAAHVVEQLGILECADLIVGTSAGATNAVALAAGAVGPLTDSYADTFTSPEFIDTKRLLRGRPALNYARLLEELESKFSVSRPTREGPRQVALVATDVATAGPVALTDFVHDDEVLSAVAASSRLPLIGGAPVEFRGRRWIDGGVSDAVPVASAAALGATHAIVITTRPRESTPSLGLSDRAIASYLHRLNPELAQTYRERPNRYQSLMAQLGEDRAHGVKTLLISPAIGDPVPSRLERDPEILRRAAQAARTSARMTLAGVISAEP